MKTKTVYTSALKYAKRIRIVTEEYADMDGSLYVGLYTMSGEPYADITTFLYAVKPPFGYVEIGSDAEMFVLEQAIAEHTEAVTKSGFNTYRMYDFSKLMGV